MKTKIRDKPWLLSVTIVDGEHEHSGYVIIYAPHEPRARTMALTEILKYDSSGFDAEDSYFGYGDGLTITKFRGVQRLTTAEVIILQRLGIAYPAVEVK